jgi:hypothetical protein
MYLFPLEWYTLIKRAQATLARRQHQRDQAAARQAWLCWLANLHGELKHKDAARRRQSLKQALAAGKRYLYTAAPSDVPQVYHLTEQVCEELERRLQAKQRRG